ncbi:MAG: haloalkane dehalogenase [Gammaproteobacteria bacterium]|nr:haloalkane dehalogenase [Gammaproteobacteria bacterium]
MPTKKKFINVDGVQMAYVEMGRGVPIVFQHGNPTSSYLWRKVMPRVQKYGRCIAIDLIGMGDSDKLEHTGPSSYSFGEQAHYFELALRELRVCEDAVFVLHDWGSALGFNWCRSNPDSVKGICYMEAIVRQLAWEEWPDASRRIFQGFRSHAGEAMVLERNLFVDRVLPGSLLRPLSKKDMKEYRRPFLMKGECRRPTLTWPRMIPISGEPRVVCDIVDEYSRWLSSSQVSKLFVNADPGAILVGNQREFCRAWPNQTEVTVSAGHFVPEDAPEEVATAIAAWLEEL